MQSIEEYNQNQEKYNSLQYINEIKKKDCDNANYENEFSFIRQLQKGKCSNIIVDLVQHKKSKEFFALKKIIYPLPNQTRETTKFFIKNEIEINLLLYASKVFIPKLQFYWSRDDIDYLLFDYIQGEDLHNFLVNSYYRMEPIVSIRTKLSIFEQCIVLCEKLQILGIFHQDIKPENFMLFPEPIREKKNVVENTIPIQKEEKEPEHEEEQEYKVYLLDFEFSFYIYNKNRERKSFYCVSTEYMFPPECFHELYYIKSRRVRSNKIYSWFLGNLFFLLFDPNLSFPFDQSLYLNPAKQKKFKENINNYRSHKFHQWIRTYSRLPFEINLHLFPLDICRLDIILFYAFLMNDLLERLLTQNPNERIYLDQIRRHPIFFIFYSKQISFTTHNKFAIRSRSIWINNNNNNNNNNQVNAWEMINKIKMQFEASLEEKCQIPPVDIISSTSSFCSFDSLFKSCTEAVSTSKLSFPFLIKEIQIEHQIYKQNLYHYINKHFLYSYESKNINDYVKGKKLKLLIQIEPYVFTILNNIYGENRFSSFSPLNKTVLNPKSSYFKPQLFYFCYLINKGLKKQKEKLTSLSLPILF